MKEFFPPDYFPGQDIPVKKEVEIEEKEPGERDPKDFWTEKEPRFPKNYPVKELRGKLKPFPEPSEFDKSTRKILREMPKGVIEMLYEFNPEILSSDAINPIKFHVIDEARQSTRIGEKDKDSLRESKFSDSILGINMSMGIDPRLERKVSEMLRGKYTDLLETERVHPFGVTVEIKLAGLGEKDISNLRKYYGDKIVGGIFSYKFDPDYVAHGQQILKTAIRGKNPGEIMKMRGAHWMAFPLLRSLSQEYARYFTGEAKDTGEQETIAKHLLTERVKELETKGKYKMSPENKGLLHWVRNGPREAQNFLSNKSYSIRCADGKDRLFNFHLPFKTDDGYFDGVNVDKDTKKLIEERVGYDFDEPINS